MDVLKFSHSLSLTSLTVLKSIRHFEMFIIEQFSLHLQCIGVNNDVFFLDCTMRVIVLCHIVWCCAAVGSVFSFAQKLQTKYNNP